jgi:hypothetical protein
VQLAGSDYGTVLRTQELRQARHDRGDVRIGQAVQHVTWDTGETALHGTVRGQGGSVYRTAAFFSLADGRRAEFEMGECTCPIEYNCKHVVALVLSVLELGSPGSARPESRRRPGENRWTLYWTSTDLPAAARRR